MLPKAKGAARSRREGATHARETRPTGTGMHADAGAMAISTPQFSGAFNDPLLHSSPLAYTALPPLRIWVASAARCLASTAPTAGAAVGQPAVKRAGPYSFLPAVPAPSTALACASRALRSPGFSWNSIVFEVEPISPYLGVGVGVGRGLRSRARARVALGFGRKHRRRAGGGKELVMAVVLAVDGPCRSTDLNRTQRNST